MLKKGIVRTDSDDLYYRIEDTEWGVRPDDTDPGYLVPKPGAIPIPDDEAHEPEESELNPKANINSLPYNHPDNDPRID